MKKIDAEPLIFSDMVKATCLCEFEDCMNYHKYIVASRSTNLRDVARNIVRTTHGKLEMARQRRIVVANAGNNKVNRSFAK